MTVAYFQTKNKNSPISGLEPPPLNTAQYNENKKYSTVRRSESEISSRIHNGSKEEEGGRCGSIDLSIKRVNTAVTSSPIIDQYINVVT